MFPETCPARRCLKFDRGLSIVGRVLTYAQDGGAGVEEAPHAAREGTVDAAFEHGVQYAARFVSQALEQACRSGMLEQAVLPQKRKGRAARIADGRAPPGSGQGARCAARSKPESVATRNSPPQMVPSVPAPVPSNAMPTTGSCTSKSS